MRKIFSQPALINCAQFREWTIAELPVFFLPLNKPYQLRYLKILKDDALRVLQSICQQIWKTQQRPQDLKKSVFIPIPKRGNAKECSNCYTIALISHASKVMLKIHQTRLQQYMNQELPYVWDGFWRGRGTRDQITKFHWVKTREFQKKTFTSASLTMVKPLTMWIIKTWKVLKEMGIPDHLTCLLRNLYAD